MANKNNKNNAAEENQLFWNRFNNRFGFSEHLKEGFSTRMEEAFREIATSKKPGQEVTIKIEENGKIKMTELGWIFMAAIFEYAFMISETKANEYITQINELKKEIRQINKQIKEKQEQKE